MSNNIYEQTLYKFCEKIRATQTINYYENADKIALIIDPRYDYLMEAVIRQHMYFLNHEGWNLMIVSHSMYRDKIKADFPNCIFAEISEGIIYYKNDKPNITIDGYNKMFLSPHFWLSIPAENVLVFQKDCFMYKMFSSEFIDYDFVGARSVLYIENDGTQRLIYNGGLSLRKKSAMMDCLEKMSFQHIYDIIEPIINDIKTPVNLYKKNEDIFFSFACKILNKKIPDMHLMPAFSVESEFNMETSFHHGWNKNYHSREQILDILSSNNVYKDFVKYM
jgi:hypothetical protein